MLRPVRTTSDSSPACDVIGGECSAELQKTCSLQVEQTQFGEPLAPLLDLPPPVVACTMDGNGPCHKGPEDKILPHKCLQVVDGDTPVIVNCGVPNIRITGPTGRIPR